MITTQHRDHQTMTAAVSNTRDPNRVCRLSWHRITGVVCQALAVCAVIVSTGCTPMHVDLRRSDSDTEPPMSNVKHGSIAVVHLTDGRGGTGMTSRMLGTAHNALGSELAEIHAQQDPTQWIGDEFARALTAEGFTVKKLESENEAPELLAVTGTVTKLSADHYFTTHAQISTDIAVKRCGSQLFITQCHGDKKSITALGTTSEYAGVLHDAVDDLLANCMPFLTQALTIHEKPDAACEEEGATDNERN